jgi:hypothetical protein
MTLGGSRGKNRKIFYTFEKVFSYRIIDYLKDERFPYFNFLKIDKYFTYFIDSIYVISI